MKKITVGKKEIEYKDFLETNEFRVLIQESIDAFINGQPTSGEDMVLDDIRGYMGNPGCSYDAFCRTLGTLCIKDFDGELHEEIFSNGLYDELICQIKNAKKAYEIVESNLDRTLSVSNAINQALNLIISKLPEDKDLDKILKKLPKEWNKVFSEYKSITGQK